MSEPRAEHQVGVVIDLRTAGDTLLDPREDEALTGKNGLHIALMVDQFPQILGGGERVVLRLAGLLRSAGYKVSIITFQILCPAEVIRSAPCPVYLLPVDNVFGPAGLRAAWDLGRFYRRRNVDLVMTFFESSNLFGGVVAKLLSGTKVIWNRRDMGILRSGKHRFAYRMLRWLPDHVIAVSNEVRDHAIVCDGIPAAHVTVVYNGQDAWVEPQAPTAHLPPTVTTIGNIRGVKGHDVLVEAAASVLSQRPDVTFQIAGDVLSEEYFRRLHDRIHELGIEQRFHFLGTVSSPQVALKGATLFVLPSRSEGFSNAIVEAMLASLPVVATDVGGNAEAVVQGVTGLIVPPDDPKLLAEALLCILNDPKRGREMGRQGRNRAQTLFTSSAMLEKVESVISSLVGNQAIHSKNTP